MQESYGCNLDNVMFEEVDAALVNQVTSLVSDAIVEHEPRVTLSRVDVSATGEPGELLVRDPQVMLSYWNRPEETAGTVEDG